MPTTQGGQDAPVLAPPRPRCANCTSTAAHRVTSRATHRGIALRLHPLDSDAGDPMCRPCIRALGVHLNDDDTLGPRLLAGLFAALVALAVLLLAVGPEPCTDGSGSTACAATGRSEGR